MIHLFFNALAASAGAGPTYVRNIVPEISARRDVKATIALSPALRREFGQSPGVTFLEIEATGAAKRYWREQVSLPGVIRKARADVLVSTGNFALRRSPVPQILLSGNSLYVSRDFARDLISRRDYAAWLDTRIKGFFAKRSISWADVTVAPSRAFADALRDWTGHDVASIYHGFNRDPSPLLPEVQEKINAAGSALKLLFVSHYNYYRNFETLLRALPLIREQMKPRKIKLFLTCKLNSEQNPGSYRAESAAALVRELDITEEVIELGAIPYPQLHHLYRSADIYVTPAYAETFAHPLVEAMASDLPVVASDIAVHREICGASATFFPPFSASELAEGVLRVASRPGMAQQLQDHAKQRIRDFSWRAHLDQIVRLASALVSRRA
jgi:glycosyltransferase involved in cell wall biosynthesis